MKELSLEERKVLLEKYTEAPFTGRYNDFWQVGSYRCRQCGAVLYRSQDKFDAGCGWPAFDDEIEGAVKRIADADGRRTEIVCAKCGGHLGHVFTGEGFTPKNLRHCVNSLSLDFVPATKAVAYFAGGCFWGMEHAFSKRKGVIEVITGFMGGEVENPTYKEVYQDNTGHAETIRVEYDPAKTDYETLARLFFEMHDPTQVDGQGPDLGTRYRSEIFYTSEEQKAIAEKLIKILEDKGYMITTELTPASTFYPAEDYHQHYYDRMGGTPYCHVYTKRF